MSSFVFAIALLFPAAQETSRYDFTDDVPPSQSPPGGLKPEQVPLFVVFGADDNYRADGVTWMTDVFYGEHRNPPGKGNPAAFDGTPCRGTFYMIGKVEAQSGGGIQKAVNRAWRAGHEIGNHTYSHGHGTQYTGTQWRDEIARANAFFTRPLEEGGCGIDPKDIVGFRAPFDEHGPHQWAVLKSLGFVYDCSVHEGFAPEHDSGTNEYWPYTLDRGSPGGRWLHRNWKKTAVGKHPGLWEMHEQVLRIPPSLRGTYGKRKTADDWIWFNEPPRLKSRDLVEVFKHTVRLRLKSNRAPLLVCLHGQYYGTEPWFDGKRRREIDDNRKTLLEIMRFLVSRPEVRVVRAIDVIRWMRNPARLSASTEK